MFKIGNAFSRANKFYDDACRTAVAFTTKHQSSFMFVLGTVLLIGGTNEAAYALGGIFGGGAGGGVGNAQRAAVEACNRLLGYMETGFGALVAAAAGIGAIVAAAVGGFKAAWSLLVVSIGAFILRAYISLFNTGCN